MLVRPSRCLSDIVIRVTKTSPRAVTQNGGKRLGDARTSGGESAAASQHHRPALRPAPRDVGERRAQALQRGAWPGAGQRQPPGAGVSRRRASASISPSFHQPRRRPASPPTPLRFRAGSAMERWRDGYSPACATVSTAACAVVMPAASRLARGRRPLTAALRAAWLKPRIKARGAADTHDTGAGWTRRCTAGGEAG